MFEPQCFTLTEDHVKLLRAAYVDRHCPEAPGLDSKRPYGDSDVEMSIAKALGMELFEDADEQKHVSKSQRQYIEKIESEMPTALQVVLSAGTFEPGEYKCDKYDRNWQPVATFKSRR